MTSEFEQAVQHYLAGVTFFSSGAAREHCERCEGYPEGDEYDEFGTADCDSCGQSKAGARYPAHGYIGDDQTAPLEHFEICFDCVFFHAYGDIPREWP